MAEPTDTQTDTSRANTVRRTDPATGQQQATGWKMRRKKDGSWWIDDGSNFLRKVRHVDEVLQVGVDELVDQVYGNPAIDPSKSATGPATRVLMKNLLEPAAAEEWFRGKGMMVRRFGPGWDFGVKANKEDEWAYLDPKMGKSTGPVEFGLDVMDLIWDLGSGVATGLASSIPTYGAVAGAAVGSGLEAARQKAGSAVFGVENSNRANIAVSGAAGGLFSKPVGSVLKKVGGYGAEGMQEIGAMMTKAGKAGSLSNRDVFIARVKDKTPAELRMPSVDQQATRAVRMVRKWRNTVGDRVWQIEQADEMTDKLAAQGVRADISAILDSARELTAAPTTFETAIKVGSQKGASVATSMTDTVSKIEGAIDLAGDMPDGVLLNRLVEIRRMVDKQAKSLGGLDDKMKEATTIKLHEDLRDQIQSVITRVADAEAAVRGVVAPSGKKYSSLMFQGSRTLDKLESFYERAGVNLRGGPEQVQKMGQFLLGMHGASKSVDMRLALWFKRKYGIDLEPFAERATVAQKIGDEGALGVLPKITATGGIPLVEGSVGALQAGAGLSPRNVLRFGKGINQLYGAGSAMRQRVEDTLPMNVVNPATLPLIQALTQTKGRQIYRNDPSGRERLP